MVWQGKYRMEVWHWQQIGAALINPASCLTPLALGTVAIAARVVRLLDMATPYTAVEVSAERRCTTAHDIASYLGLHRSNCRLTGIRIPVRLKDVSYLTLSTPHVTTALAYQEDIQRSERAYWTCVYSASLS